VNSDREPHGWFVFAFHWQLLDLKKHDADRQDQARQSAALLVSGTRPFDFDGSDTDTITMLQHLVRRTRLAIDTNEIAAGLATNPLVEEFAHGRAFVDLNVVGEAAAVVVDEQYLHV
jgi:hypothetical protein